MSTSGWPRKSFAIWVLVGSCLFWVAYFVTVPVQDALTGSLATFEGIFVAFLVALFSAAFLWAARLLYYEKPSGYLLSVVLAVFEMITWGLGATQGVPDPQNLWRATTAPFAAGLMAVFGILCYRNSRAGLPSKAYLATWRSAGGLFTLSMVVAAIFVTLAAYLA